MITATVTVSIGRNVGNVPMPGPEWRRFRRTVSDALANGTVFVKDARTVGEWDGIAEESRTWVASVDSEVVPSLVEFLGGLAREYSQDDIAVTVGETVLAG